MFGNVYLSIFMYSTNSLTITNYNGLKLITMEWRGEKYFSRWQICINPHGTPPRVLIKRCATAQGHDGKLRVGT